jgi:hypothetical protein
MVLVSLRLSSKGVSSQLPDARRLSSIEAMFATRQTGFYQRASGLLSSATASDVYFGRHYAVLSERSKINRRTMEWRKGEYLAQKAA